MKLSIHVRPERSDHSSQHGTITGRESEQLDEIARLLAAEGGDARVVEAPLAAAPESDFWLVFTEDIEWHLESMPDVDPRRLFLLKPSRDVAFELLDELRPAGAVAYEGARAWAEAPRTGTVVRREIASELGGELGVGLPYFKATDRYASWMKTDHPTLAAQVVAYLRAAR